MFQSMLADIAAQGVKKVVMAIMARPEKSARFSHQLLIGRQVFRRHLQIGFAVRDQIHLVIRLLRPGIQIDSPEVLARDQR